MQDWIIEELGTSDLGDRRLDKRLARLLDRASRKPPPGIPAGCEGWRETVAAVGGGRHVNGTENPLPGMESTATGESSYPRGLPDTSEVNRRITQPNSPRGSCT